MSDMNKQFGKDSDQMLISQLEQELIAANSASADMYTMLDSSTSYARNLEQQMLEKDAKIDDLRIHLEVASYEAGIEMSNDHKSFVALHDADVIDCALKEALASCEVAKKYRWDYLAAALEAQSRKLRNSTKEEK